MPLLIGPISLHFAIYALAALVHLVLARRWCRRLGLSPLLAVGLSVCFVLGMGLGARLLHDLFLGRLSWSNYLRPGYYFSDGLWGGPLAYLGLSVGLALALPRIHVRSINLRRVALDLVVLSLPIPLAIVKFACLVNGCCFGSPCGWPWGIVYPYRAQPPEGVPRHPTQIYEAGALLFIYFMLVTLERRRWSGMLILWFVFLYGIARPVSEFFRMPPVKQGFLGALSLSQAICLSGSAIALGVLWKIRPPRSSFEAPIVRPAFT